MKMINSSLFLFIEKYDYKTQLHSINICFFRDFLMHKVISESDALNEYNETVHLSSLQLVVR